MSGLADRLISEMAGHDVPTTPMSFRQKAEELRRTVGVSKGAEIAGVDRRTFQRWFEKWNAGKDHHPRQRSLDAVDLGVRLAWTAREVPDFGWAIQVNDRNDPRRSTRTVSMAQLKLYPGTMERVAEVYRATGNAEAAAAAFLAGVGDRFYRRWLTPPSGQREGFYQLGTGEPEPEAGGLGEEWDEIAGPVIPETAYDEFMDAEFEVGVSVGVPDDEGYGGDVA